MLKLVVHIVTTIRLEEFSCATWNTQLTFHPKQWHVLLNACNEKQTRAGFYSLVWTTQKYLTFMGPCLVIIF